MRRKMPIGLRWLLMIAVAVALMSVLLATLASGGDDDTPPPRAEYSNLADDLKEIAWAYDAWLASGRPESSAPVNLDWEVGVFVWISSNLAGILSFLEDNDVYNVEGSYQGESNTLAFVPVPVLSSLAKQPGVRWADMMFPPEPPVDMEPPLDPTWTPVPTRAESLVRGSSGLEPAPTEIPQKYPRMDNTMSSYLEQYERGEITEAEAVESIGNSEVGAPYVRIMVYGEDEAGVRAALKANGLASNNEAFCFNYGGVSECQIDAVVHLNSLVSLSQHKSILGIRRIKTAQRPAN